MLTDTAIRNAKPGPKTARLYDTGGLYLEVPPTGRKRWRLKYRYQGRERRISLGTYSDVTLAEARRKRDEERKLLAAGIDPGAQRKSQRAAGTFEDLAREWWAREAKRWAPTYSDKVLSRLERFAFPHIGGMAPDAIDTPALLSIARRPEAQGHAETARRILHICAMVFRYAIATGAAKHNPAVGLGRVVSSPRVRHMAAPTDPAHVGALLRAVENYPGEPSVAAALRILPRVFTRPGELRLATWDEFDLERGEWRIPAHRMKMRREHIVPLSRQVVAMLRELFPITGPQGYVFKGLRPGRPITDATVGAALKRLGINTREELTSHGWRAVARSLLHERLGFGAEAIEAQLAHKPPTAMGDAYARAQHIDTRRRMMQTWADYLDKLRDGADVVLLRRTEA